LGSSQDRGDAGLTLAPAELCADVRPIVAGEPEPESAT